MFIWVKDDELSCSCSALIIIRERISSRDCCPQLFPDPRVDIEHSQVNQQRMLAVTCRPRIEGRKQVKQKCKNNPRISVIPSLFPELPQVCSRVANSGVQIDEINCAFPYNHHPPGACLGPHRGNWKPPTCLV